MKLSKSEQVEVKNTVAAMFFSTLSERQYCRYPGVFAAYFENRFYLCPSCWKLHQMHSLAHNCYCPCGQLIREILPYVMLAAGWREVMTEADRIQQHPSGLKVTSYALENDETYRRLCEIIQAEKCAILREKEEA